MATFQDARDGLDALLKDGARNLSPNDKDAHIKNAARIFSRRFPRILAVEVTGDGGFEYAPPTGFVDGFSTITDVFFPWDPTDQDPEKMERKDFVLFEGPNGLKLRFRQDRPATTQQFLAQFTAPHIADASETDVIAQLSDAGTVIDGADVISAKQADVESAADVQVFIKVTAAVGNDLDVIIQASEDGTNFFDIASFKQISGVGDFIEPLPKRKVSKFLRLKYTTTGGSFTFEAKVVKAGAAGTLTIPDHNLDALAYISAAIASQALADFYSNLVDSQLEGDTTDYEGKATFWQANHDKWDQKWKEELDKIGPTRGASAFRQGEWDLKGTTGFRLVTHAERDR